jgi:hypothetical protein
VSLVARHLEENGIPTVTIATARDIVERCGVARLVHTDYPLGNPCGQPFNLAEQRQIVDLAMNLLETAVEPQTTVTAPFEWPKGDDWKRLVLTDERPFLEGEHYDKWMEGKDRYRKLKEEGKV